MVWNPIRSLYKTPVRISLRTGRIRYISELGKGVCKKSQPSHICLRQSLHATFLEEAWDDSREPRQDLHPVHPVLLLVQKVDLQSCMLPTAPPWKGLRRDDNGWPAKVWHLPTSQPVEPMNEMQEIRRTSKAVIVQFSQLIIQKDRNGSICLLQSLGEICPFLWWYFKTRPAVPVEGCLLG